MKKILGLLFLFCLGANTYAFTNNSDAAAKYLTTAKQTSINNAIATSNLFSSANGHLYVFKSNPSGKIFAINATSNPLVEAGIGYDSIRAFLKGELRLEATNNVKGGAQGGKISFGNQRIVAGIRDAYIERIPTTTVGVAEINLHAYSRLFLTTGVNKNNISQYRKNAGKAGVYINNFSTANMTKGIPPAAEARPLVFHKAISKDAYAITMEHVDDPESTEKKPEGVLRLSLISRESNNDRNYIAFSDSQQSLIGSIGGHEAYVMGIAQSGIKLESAGADYAEYLEKINPSEQIEPGDIVGVFDGKITKKTKGAHQVMVVSTMPLVIGNKKNNANMLPVVFIGQAPVKVIGQVKSGRYIVASGSNDGSGKVVRFLFFRTKVGQAWSSSLVKKEKFVNVLIR